MDDRQGFSFSDFDAQFKAIKNGVSQGIFNALPTYSRNLREVTSSIFNPKFDAITNNLNHNQSFLKEAFKNVDEGLSSLNKFQRDQLNIITRLRDSEIYSSFKPKQENTFANSKDTISTFNRLNEEYKEELEKNYEMEDELRKNSFDTNKKQNAQIDKQLKKTAEKQKKRIKDFFETFSSNLDRVTSKLADISSIYTAVNIAGIGDGVRSGIQSGVDALRETQKVFSYTNEETKELSNSINLVTKSLNKETGNKFSSEEITKATTTAMLELGERNQESGLLLGTNFARAEKGLGFGWDQFGGLASIANSNNLLDSNFFKDMENTLVSYQQQGVNASTLGESVSKRSELINNLSQGDPEQARILTEETIKSSALASKINVDAEKIFSILDNFSKNDSSALRTVSFVSNPMEIRGLLEENNWSEATTRLLEGIGEASNKYGNNQMIRETFNIDESVWNNAGYAFSQDVNVLRDATIKFNEAVERAIENNEYERHLQESTYEGLFQKIVNKMSTSSAGRAVQNAYSATGLGSSDIGFLKSLVMSIAYFKGFKFFKNKFLLKPLQKLGFLKNATPAVAKSGKIGSAFGKTFKFLTSSASKSLGSFNTLASTISKSSKPFNILTSTISKSSKHLSTLTSTVSKSIKPFGTLTSTISKSGNVLKNSTNIFKTFNSTASKIAPALSKITPLFSKLAAPLSKLAAPLTGIFAAFDGIGASKKSKNWLGDKEGSTVKGKIATFAGGVLGGNNESILSKNSTMGDKFSQLGAGLLKGGTAGAFAGPIGILAGAAIGGILSSIGGKNISKFLNGTANLFTGKKRREKEKNEFDINLELVEAIDSSRLENTYADAYRNASKSMDRVNQDLAKKTVLYQEEETKKRKWYNPASWFDGSHKDGLNRVPFDGYKAILHKDETVLNKEQAKTWRKSENAKSSLSYFKNNLSDLLSNARTMALNYKRNGISNTLLNNNNSNNSINNSQNSSEPTFTDVTLPKDAPKLSGSKSKFLSQVLNGTILTYKKYGILPSLTLAQGALESNWGKSAIGNNLFGIKAGANWKGMRQKVWTKEEKNGKKYSVQAWFRDYPSIDDSVLDHGSLLSGKRYASVRQANNYKEATHAVKNAGYATDSAYPQKLIKLIEGNKFHYYDNPDVINRISAEGADSSINKKTLKDYFFRSSKNNIPKYEQGTPFVPETNIALLHKGEMVVPAKANPMANMSKKQSITDTLMQNNSGKTKENKEKDNQNRDKKIEDYLMLLLNELKKINTNVEKESQKPLMDTFHNSRRSDLSNTISKDFNLEY